MRYTVHPYRVRIMDDATEFYEERAAIMQYDGGYKRYDAEYYAEHLTRVYCERTGNPLPEYRWFHFYTHSSTGWNEQTGRAYYIPPPPFETRA